MRIHPLVATLFSTLLLPIQALAVTAFYYTSSPESWVGHGETVLVTPSHGFEFTASRNFDNGVSFAINDFNANPDFQASLWWYSTFPHRMMPRSPSAATLGQLVFPFSRRMHLA